MIARSDISALRPLPRAGKPIAVRRVLGSIAAEVTAWIETCGDYYTAAAAYEQLSRLSDAALRRRGLSRATLAADVARACDRTR